MTFKLDLRDFERMARDIDAFADQVPFALAGAMNDAVTATRKELIEQTWPKHVAVRNRAFLGAALRREFARKNSLRVAIDESGPAAGKGNLVLHSEGGARRARRLNLAIPNEALKAKRTGKGVPKGLRPGALPNAFKKGDVIYQRTGAYQKGGKGSKGVDNRHLKLVYVLKPSVSLKADVPFEKDFETIMRREVARAFGPRIRKAMATRR